MYLVNIKHLFLVWTKEELSLLHGIPTEVHSLFVEIEARRGFGRPLFYTECFAKST